MSEAPIRVRDLVTGEIRSIPADTPCVPAFVLSFDARLLAHPRGITVLDEAAAREAGDAPVAALQPDTAAYVRDPADGRWRLAARMDDTPGRRLSDGWHVLPCGGALLVERGRPVRLTDGAINGLEDNGPLAGTDPDTVRREAEALLGCVLHLGPWRNEPGELDATADVASITASVP